MDLRKRLPLVLMVLLLFTVGLWQTGNAQYVTISGNVYDITARRPLEAVGVLSNSGHGALTDSTGHYIITVPANDSIWF